MSIDLKTFVNGCSSRCIDDPQEIGKIISQMLQIKGRDFDEDENRTFCGFYGYIVEWRFFLA